MKFVVLLYISLVGITGEAHANESEATIIAEEQCGKYIHKAVRPLTNYIDQLKAEIEDHNNKIERKDEEIRRLQEKLAQQNEHIMKEQRTQLDFYKRTIEELAENALYIKDQINKLTIQNCANQLEQQNKPVDENISNIENEINICASKLETFQDRPIPNSCTHFRDITGIHAIKIDNITIDVLCDSGTAGPGWTVIQQRINGLEDFYMDWKAYRAGFGSFDGDFFLGLENIHRLTSAQPHELYIHMEDFDGDIQYVRYAEFAIAGEDDQYRLITLGRAEGNATLDAMDNQKNQKFSTYDRDNDSSSSHVANLLRSGWWFNDYNGSNLNGRYYYRKKFDVDAVHWKTIQSLKKVKMLIRPKNNVE